MKGVPDLPYAAKLFIVPNSCGPDRERKSSHFAALCSAAREHPIDIVQSIFRVRTIFFLVNGFKLGHYPKQGEGIRQSDKQPWCLRVIPSEAKDLARSSARHLIAAKKFARGARAGALAGLLPDAPTFFRARANKND